MKFAIDKVEDGIAVLENIKTGEKKEVNISLLPFNAKEKDVLYLKDRKYILDLAERNNRLEKIKNKFERLKRQ